MQYLGNSFHYLRNVTSCSQAGGVAHLRSVLTAESLGPRYRPQIHTSRVARSTPVTPALQGANTLFWAPLSYPPARTGHAHLLMRICESIRQSVFLWKVQLSIPCDTSTLLYFHRGHNNQTAIRLLAVGCRLLDIWALLTHELLGSWLLIDALAELTLLYFWILPSGPCRFFFLLRMHPAHVFLSLLPCHKLKKTRILLHPHWELLAYCPLYKYLCSLKLDGGDRQISRSLRLLWARAIATMLTTQFCAFAPLCFLALVIPFPADKMWTIAHPTYLHGS